MDIKGFKDRDGNVHQYDYDALSNKPESTPGGFVVSETEPTDKNVLWVDTNDNTGEMPPAVGGQPLKFTGAVTATYDGTQPVTVEIPVGGTTPGADGFSPIAAVTQTEDGAAITITDKDGTTTAVVKNGKDGKDGQPGEPGKDYALTDNDRQEIARQAAEEVR